MDKDDQGGTKPAAVTAPPQISSESLRSIFDAAPFPITVTSPVDGKLLYANRTTFDFYGLDYEKEKDTLIYAPIYYVRSEDREAIIAAIRRDGKAIDHVIEMRLRDGSTRWLSFSAILTLFDGQPGILSSQFDVSERVRAEMALKVSEENLKKANEKLESTVAALLEANRELVEEREKQKTLLAKQEAMLGEIKTLSGLLPICANCKKIREETGGWTRIEKYIAARSTADFTHSLCPECCAELYPDIPLGKPKS